MEGWRISNQRVSELEGDEHAGLSAKWQNLATCALPVKYSHMQGVELYYMHIAMLYIAVR